MMPGSLFILSSAVAAIGFAASVSVVPEANQDHPPPLQDEGLKSLAAAMRGLLVQAMPAVLYEASPNWGHKAPPRLGIRHSPRNDGTWRKIRLSTRNPASTLVVDVR